MGGKAAWLELCSLSEREPRESATRPGCGSSRQAVRQGSSGSSLVPGRLERESCRAAKREGGRPLPAGGSRFESRLHPEPLAELLWTSSSAWPQSFLNHRFLSAATWKQSKPGTGPVAPDRAEAGLRQGSRLGGQLCSPCRHSRVKQSERKDWRGLGERGADRKGEQKRPLSMSKWE